jgi:hypothetical protein
LYRNRISASAWFCVGSGIKGRRNYLNELDQVCRSFPRFLDSAHSWVRHGPSPWCGGYPGPLRGMRDVAIDGSEPRRLGRQRCPRGGRLGAVS